MFHEDRDYVELESVDDKRYRMQDGYINCLIDGTWLRCWWLDEGLTDGTYVVTMRKSHAPKNWTGKGHNVAEKIKIKVDTIQVHDLEDMSCIYVRTWADLLYCCDFENDSHVAESTGVAASIRAIGYIEIPGDWKAV